jgi:UrcA family protein
MTKFLPFLILAAASPPVLAQPAEPVTSIVRTADLDLASEAGQRALDKRVARAIIEVCGVASPADLTGQNKVRDCRKEARSRFDAERDQRIAAASPDPILVAAR